MSRFDVKFVVGSHLPATEKTKNKLHSDQLIKHEGIIRCSRFLADLFDLIQIKLIHILNDDYLIKFKFTFSNVNRLERAGRFRETKVKVKKIRKNDSNSIFR